MGWQDPRTVNEATARSEFLVSFVVGFGLQAIPTAVWLALWIRKQVRIRRCAKFSQPWAMRRLKLYMRKGSEWQSVTCGYKTDLSVGEDLHFDSASIVTRRPITRSWIPTTISCWTT